MFYTMERTIDSRDVDGLGRCRCSALLGHLQQAATEAAVYGGFGRKNFLERYGAFWMLVRMWMDLRRPLLFDEKVTVKTWHRGERHALLHRDYDIFVGDEQVGEGVSAWVLARQSDRKLLRIGGVAELEGTGGGALCKTMSLGKIAPPQKLELAERRRMRYSDTDINGHVNNTRYADFVCDVLGEQCLAQDSFLSQMQISYIAECRPGETLNLYQGTTAAYDFLRGVDELGKTRFEASTTFSEVIH